MKAIQRTLRRDWPSQPLVSLIHSGAAGFEAEAIDTSSILTSIKKIGKGVLNGLRRRSWQAPRRQRFATKVIEINTRHKSNNT